MISIYHYYHRNKPKKKEIIYDQKTAILTEEEKRMREENLQARPCYTDTGIKALLYAVAWNAVKAYINEIKSNPEYMIKHPTPEMDTCEQYFNCEWFGSLTNGLDASDVKKQFLSSPSDDIFKRVQYKVRYTYVQPEKLRRKRRKNAESKINRTMSDMAKK